VKLKPLLMIFILLAAGGCASKKFNTTLDFSDVPGSCPKTKFRIASVDPLSPDEFFITGYTASDYWHEKVKGSGHMSTLTRDLQEKACLLYPHIFDNDNASLPLHIAMVTRSYRNTAARSSFLAALTWGLFGIVLPLPLGFSCDYEVIVSCPPAGIVRETEFGTKLSSWLSFPSPLALVPVPGRAHRRGTVLYPWQSRYYTGRHFMLECFARAIVRVLNSADCGTFPKPGCPLTKKANRH